MKVLVAPFNQEKGLVASPCLLTNLRMELFQALTDTAAAAIGLVAWLALYPHPSHKPGARAGHTNIGISEEI